MNVKKLRRGMLVKTDFSEKYFDAIFKIQHIEKDDDCHSGYGVHLVGVKCEHCNVVPWVSDWIDAGWVKEIVDVGIEPDFEAGFNILMEHWDDLPEDVKDEIDLRLEEHGL